MQFLPENTAAFADPRLELIIDDAKAVLEKAAGFDVIIMDLDDPLEGGAPATRCTTHCNTPTPLTAHACLTCSSRAVRPQRTAPATQSHHPQQHTAPPTATHCTTHSTCLTHLLPPLHMPNPPASPHASLTQHLAPPTQPTQHA